MTAGNLTTSPRFLGIEQDSAVYYAKRKLICSTLSSPVKYAN